MTVRYMPAGEVAAHVGLKASTIIAYRRDGYMPEPDVLVGDVAGWSVATIDHWMANRLGRGARTDLIGGAK